MSPASLVVLASLLASPHGPKLAEHVLSVNWNSSSACSVLKRNFEMKVASAANGVEILEFQAPGHAWPGGTRGQVNCHDGRVLVITFAAKKPKGTSLDDAIDVIGARFDRQYTYSCEDLPLPEVQNLDTCRVLATDNAFAVVTSADRDEDYAVTIAQNTPESEQRLRALQR